MKTNHLKDWKMVKNFLSYHIPPPRHIIIMHQLAVETGDAVGNCLQLIEMKRDVSDCQNLNVPKFDCIINWYNKNEI